MEITRDVIVTLGFKPMSKKDPHGWILNLVEEDDVQMEAREPYENCPNWRFRFYGLGFKEIDTLADLLKFAYKRGFYWGKLAKQTEVKNVLGIPEFGGF